LIPHHSWIFRRALSIIAVPGCSVGPWRCWQWSVPIGKDGEFLWALPNYKHFRAVVVGQNNMIEQDILEHPISRKSPVDEGKDGKRH